MSIKAFRESLGLRQEDFAKIIGTSKVNYSKKENGSIRFSLAEAHKIAIYFNKPIEAIFYDYEVSKNETIKTNHYR
ncbi:MAG TPA: helix-turn-helix domain-containing protein [Candidatus Mediterraneibacter intestinipullorum]|nr:helix-turn-helix domain-containing protein [Candidatus Mediterraneibacter intestinipullorum]